MIKIDKYPYIPLIIIIIRTTMETFNVNIKYRISETVKHVFDAIVNPEKIIKHFVSKVSGKLAEGEKILRKFEDFGVKCEKMI